MNWDAVGAISELVGVIAIVISLIYLVRETRKIPSQSTQHPREKHSTKLAIGTSRWLEIPS